MNNLDTLRSAVNSGNVTHSRARPFCGDYIIYVYVRAPESPTGVTLLASFDDCPEVQTILNGGLSPLSPIEAR